MSSEGNGYVTRDELFSSPPKRRYTDVTISGQRFRLRTLNDKEASRHDSQKLNLQGELNRGVIETANVRIIMLVVVDGEGDPLFSGEDFYALQQMDSGFISALAAECLGHCKIDEEPEKNLPETLADDSPTE